MKSTLGLIDYEFGNTQSVCNALDKLDTKFILCSSPEKLNLCSHIILPGVGSFGSSMKSLKKLKLISSLNENILDKKKFFLGICVGFQIIFSEGYEFKASKGLGWIDGKCYKINKDNKYNMILPHTGWNEVKSFDSSKLFSDIKDKNKNFYFNHSYIIDDVSKKNGTIFSYTDYGDEFVSAVQKENIFGVQFHPEKSQNNGLQLLKNFVNLKNVNEK